MDARWRRIIVRARRRVLWLVPAEEHHRAEAPKVQVLGVLHAAAGHRGVEMLLCKACPCMPVGTVPSGTLAHSGSALKEHRGRGGGDGPVEVLVDCEGMLHVGVLLQPVRRRLARLEGFEEKSKVLARALGAVGGASEALVAVAAQAPARVRPPLQLEQLACTARPRALGHGRARAAQRPKGRLNGATHLREGHTAAPSIAAAPSRAAPCNRLARR